MDFLQQALALTGGLTGVAGAAAAVLIATAKRRDIRDRQWRDLLDERNDLQTRYDELRGKYDAILDWAYKVRAALRRQNIDVPDLPKDD